MQICNVTKNDFRHYSQQKTISDIDVLDELDLNNIKTGTVIDFKSFSEEVILKYTPYIYKNIKINKNNKISKDDFELIDDIYVDTIESRRENIIILNAELGINSYFLKKLFEKLEDLNTTIILVSERPLALKNKHLIKEYFGCQTKYGIKNLRNQIKRTLIKTPKNSWIDNKIERVRQSFGILKSYKTNNEESKKFYESILNKPVSVLTMTKGNIAEVAIIKNSDNKKDYEVFFNKKQNDYKTSTLRHLIKKDNEITFIISDKDMFTIEVPAILLNIYTLVIDICNFNLLYTMAELYFKHGEDFIRYKDRDDIDSGTKKILERGLDEIGIELQIDSYDNMIKEKQENKEG
ncbi:hypothetical protein [Aliarcobacter butzleri]|uniref:hypothetical protein n=1 Tax=Aliarcobacter butzleri TaxID=28197 RepID=UPI001269C31A|nr:hypothetical protein [Aliarcobacter butzleri]